MVKASMFARRRPGRLYAGVASCIDTLPNDCKATQPFDYVLGSVKKYRRAELRPRCGGAGVTPAGLA
jgi:hypothetical protein